MVKALVEPGEGPIVGDLVALVGAFSVIVKTNGSFAALHNTQCIDYW